MPQAIWKGSIRFGLVNIPVAVYSAEEKEELSFTLLEPEEETEEGEHPQVIDIMDLLKRSIEEKGGKAKARAGSKKAKKKRRRA